MARTLARAVKRLAGGWGGSLLACGVVFAAQAFQESGGQVVIEAERADWSIPRSGKTWTLETITAGYSGSGYLTALPNTGTSLTSSSAKNSPELQFTVRFVTTGTYYVWVRGTAATTADDSLHAGRDGSALTSSDRISASGWLSGFTWTRNTLDGPPASFTIATPGIHLLQLWMAEDGFKVDKLLLTTNSALPTPTGTGPEESARLVIPDATAPVAPGQPKEGGSATDYDYDGDGAYTVYWAAASDPESTLRAYALEEWSSASNTWASLSTTVTTARSFTVSGRTHNTRYRYRVKAQNTAELWSAWSAESDGLLVDKTNPTAVTVTDDGATTSSTTSLHAVWTASSDPESGLSRYEYLIKRDSTSGAILVNWTQVGLATSVTRTGLTLVDGVTYYLGVLARNQAGRYSTIAYSDGIRVQTAPADTTPPSITAIAPLPGPGRYAGDTLSLSASIIDTDPSPVEYQFTIDGVIRQAWSATATYPWGTTSALAGRHTITVDVRDAGGVATRTQTLYLYHRPPTP